MLEMISLENALGLLLERIKVSTEEWTDLHLAHYRILAREIFAPINQPPFHRSPLDGYAVRGIDLASASRDAPVRLKITETLAAGFIARGRVEPGTAVKIMTGAPIPPGADTVVPFEQSRDAGGNVEIFVPLPPGSNLVKAGEDITSGNLVLERGTQLTSSEIGVLSALGLARVDVYRRPRVAVLSTGDELMGLGEDLTPGKIYNSNLYSLAALIQENGGEAVPLGNAPDRAVDTAYKITDGLLRADLVITTGGASVGEYDVIKDALEMVGAQLLFWKVAMKPGTPVLAALAGEKLILGLSGNPAAALISFEVLVRPLLRKMAGFSDLFRTRIRVKLVDSFAKKSSLRRFLRARVEPTEGALYARLAGAQNPGVLTSLLNTNAYLDIPGNNGVLREGDIVEAIIIGQL